MAEDGECPAIGRLPSAVALAVRGASVIPSLGRAVEELVLNAVDAEAGRVEVVLHGEVCVEVRDNGRGISPADFPSLGEAGATSKGGDQGQRGEALVALRHLCGTFTIDSKARGDADATWSSPRQRCCTWRKRFVAGELVDCQVAGKAARGPGTTVLAERLFASLPVRRLSVQPAAEMAAARLRLERIALMHPKVHFSLWMSKEHLVLPPVLGSTGVSRLGQILGQHFDDVLHRVSHREGAYSLEGSMSLPHRGAQASDRLMFLFVNRRFVEKTPVHSEVTRLHAQCVEIFNGRRVDVGRGPVSMAAAAAGRVWPAFLLNLSCPARDYDIGYSPDRTRVEFGSWRTVLRCVRGAMRRLFTGHSEEYAVAFTCERRSRTPRGRRGRGRALDRL